MQQRIKKKTISKKKGIEKNNSLRSGTKKNHTYFTPLQTSSSDSASGLSSNHSAASNTLSIRNKKKRTIPIAQGYSSLL